MKNFLLGAVAMLVLFAGGYTVWSMAGSSQEVDPETGEVIAANSANGGGSVRTSILGNRTNASEAETGEGEAAETTGEGEASQEEEPEPSPQATPTARPTATPVPTPPRPRPTAIAARPVCNTGPFIVFFEWDRTRLTGDARAVLDNAVAAYASCGNARVRVAGHTDTANSSRYAVGLSERMASSVVDYLTSRGIPASRISSEAFGESQLRVPTADGVREQQNRRVEVTFGP